MAYKLQFLEKLNFLSLDWATYLAPDINQQGKFIVRGLRGKRREKGDSPMEEMLERIYRSVVDLEIDKMGSLVQEALAAGIPISDNC